MFKATSMAELGTWRMAGPRVSGTNSTSPPYRPPSASDARTEAHVF